jgi:hypothetical protein
MSVPFLLVQLFGEAYLAIDTHGYFTFPMPRKAFEAIDRAALPPYAADLHELQVLFRCYFHPI